MDVSRREVLLGAGAAPLQGLPTAGGLALGGVDEADLPRLLAELEHKIDGFSDETLAPALQGRLEALGLPGATLHHLFASLLTTSLVRDLPAGLQEDARVQQVLEGRLVALGAAAVQLRDLYERTPDATLTAMAARLRADPRLFEDLKRAMSPWFGPQAVEPERQGQVNQALDRIQWDLLEGDAVAVYRDQARQIERFERLAARLLARQGADPFEDEGPPDDACGEALAREPRREDPRPEGQGFSKARREWLDEARGACAFPGGGYDPRFIPVKRRATARRLAIIGAALTGLGAATVPILVGLCILTPAVVLLLTALLLVLSAEVAESTLAAP